MTDQAGTGSSDEDPTLGKKAVRGFAWQVLSFGGNRLVLFISTLILARILDPRDFGVFAAALTFTAYLEVLLDFGVGSFLVYDQEEGVTDRVHTAFLVNAAVTVAITAAAVVTSPLTARLLGAPGQAGVFAVTSLYLILRGAAQLNQSMLVRDLHFKKQTLINVSGAVGRAILTVILAFAGLGVWAIVGGFLLGETVNTVLLWAFVRYRPRLRFRAALARQMLRFGLGEVALDLLNALTLNGDYLVIGATIGDVALGLYSIAFRLADLLINNALWMFSSIAFPLYSKSRAAGQERINQIMIRALRLTTLYGFAAGVGLALLSRDLIALLFGHKWAPAVDAMVLLSLAAAAGSVGYASGPVFPALGRPGALVKLSVPEVVLELGAFVAVASHGIFWIAMVHLVGNCVFAVVRIVYVNRILGSTARESARALAPALTIALGMVTFALPVRLATTTGLPSLLAILVAAIAGGVAGAALWGRTVWDEVRGIAGNFRSARSR